MVPGRHLAAEEGLDRVRLALPETLGDLRHAQVEIDQHAAGLGLAGEREGEIAGDHGLAAALGRRGDGDPRPAIVVQRLHQPRAQRVEGDMRGVRLVAGDDALAHERRRGSNVISLEREPRVPGRGRRRPDAGRIAPVSRHPRISARRAVAGRRGHRPERRAPAMAAGPSAADAGAAGPGLLDRDLQTFDHRALSCASLRRAAHESRSWTMRIKLSRPLLSSSLDHSTWSGVTYWSTAQSKAAARR